MDARCPRPWVHVPEDGRGLRDVAVDGVPVARVFYADTRRGIVRAYREPLTLDKHGKRILTYTLRGKVTVTPAGQQEQPSTPRAGSGSTAGGGEAGRAAEGRRGSEAGHGRVAPISETSDVPRGTAAWNRQGVVESSTGRDAGTSPQLFNRKSEMNAGGGP